MSTLDVLAIEDNPGDVRLIREALEEDERRGDRASLMRTLDLASVTSYASHAPPESRRRGRRNPCRTQPFPITR